VFFLIIIFSNFSFAECPIPGTMTKPELSVKVDFDKKNNIYNYIYTLKNEPGALLRIKDFTLKIHQAPEEIKSPLKWYGEFNNARINLPSNVSWDTSDREISPGNSEVFSIQSHLGPGLIPYYVDGRTEVPKAVTFNEDDEAFPNCPGFYFNKNRFEKLTTGMTEGPVSNNQISLKLKLRANKDLPEAKIDRFELHPYQESGNLTVVAKSSKDFDVSDINVPSLRFGVGKATPIWSELRPKNFAADSDDIKNESKAHNLWLQFNLDQIDIECDRDNVLFLEGTTKDGVKRVLGGVPIKATECDKLPTNSKRLNEWNDRKKFWRKVKSKKL
jgi:hypothetical protein